MRRADRGDPPVDTQRLELVKPPLPSDEVVNLVEVDPPLERAHGECDLAVRLVVVRRPHLGRHDRGIAASGECRSKNALGLSVHRRAVEEAAATGQGGIDDPPDIGLRPRPANIEGPPGPGPDDGDAQPGRTERPVLHDQADVAFDFFGFGAFGGSVRTCAAARSTHPRA